MLNFFKFIHSFFESLNIFFCLNWLQIKANQYKTIEFDFNFFHCETSAYNEPAKVIINNFLFIKFKRANFLFVLKSKGFKVKKIFNDESLVLKWYFKLFKFYGMKFSLCRQ